MIQINTDPTRRELRSFAGLLLLFFAALGGVLLWRPEALVGASVFLTVAVVASLLLNRDSPRSTQALGFLLPAVFGLAGVSVKAGVPAMTVAYVLWGGGVVLSLVVWADPASARRIYVGWMLAAQPIGWTISHIVLALVFYVVITPIGLVMRALGRDPMQRRFDRQATTYWQPRRPVTDVKQYFRQF